MRSRSVGNGEARYLLVFDKGDEVGGSLLEFARQEQLTAASFTPVFRNVP